MGGGLKGGRDRSEKKDCCDNQFMIAFRTTAVFLVGFFVVLVIMFVLLAEAQVPVVRYAKNSFAVVPLNASFPAYEAPAFQATRPTRCEFNVSLFLCQWLTITVSKNVFCTTVPQKHFHLDHSCYLPRISDGAFVVYRMVVLCHFLRRGPRGVADGSD